jgi:hypothetical protein
LKGVAVAFLVVALVVTPAGSETAAAPPRTALTRSSYSSEVCV